MDEIDTSCTVPDQMPGVQLGVTTAATLLKALCYCSRCIDSWNVHYVLEGKLGSVNRRKS